MKAQEQKMETVTNNMANVDLNGYKKDVASFKSFPSLLLRRSDDTGNYNLPFGSTNLAPVVGKLGMGVEYNETYTDFEQGPLKGTKNPFDLALDNKGFFSVQTPQGERYTRNGAFTISKEGFLVTEEGYPLLGEKGPIPVKKNNFKINVEGDVIYNPSLEKRGNFLVTQQENNWEQEEILDTLKIVDFERPRYLKKQGESLWYDTEISGGARVLAQNNRPGVLEGFLEGSNVNIVKEMVNLITVNRAYEASQKTLQTQDSLLDRLLNQTSRY